MTERDLVRFGGIVRARREELGLQQEEMRIHGGPSSTTMSGIERGTAAPSPLSLRRLDTGLQWEEGSAKHTLDGGEPTPLIPTKRYPRKINVEEWRARAAEHADPEAERFIEEALAVAERRRLEEDARRGGSSGVIRFLQIRRKPEQDRTPEERAFLQQRLSEQNRLAELAQRSTAEAPLIDLVVDGQTLAEVKSDPDVSAYVRQVESVVVGFLGIERLTDALDGRLMERTIRRAVEGGVLEEFSDEVDRLNAAGIEGRDRVLRLSQAVDYLLHEQYEWQSKPRGAEQPDNREPDRRLPRETNSQSDRDRPGTDTSGNTTETDSEITGSGDRVPRGFLADQVDSPAIDESTVDEPHGADQL